MTEQSFVRFSHAPLLTSQSLFYQIYQALDSQATETPLWTGPVRDIDNKPLMRILVPHDLRQSCGLDASVEAENTN